MPSERRIIWLGQKLTLYAVVAKGGCQVDAFLEGLPGPVQTAFRGRFEHLCDVGRLRSPGSWRQLDDGIFEVKVDKGPGYRIYMLRDGNDFTATHARKKPKDNKVPGEVKKANNIFTKYQAGEL